MEGKDYRLLCQVCGEEGPDEYGLYKLEQGVHVEKDKYHLCGACAEKFINGLQVAIPDIVEGR